MSVKTNVEENEYNCTTLAITIIETAHALEVKKGYLRMVKITSKNPVNFDA